MKDSTLLAQEHSKYVSPTNRGDMSVIGAEFKLRAVDKREVESMTGEDAYVGLVRSIGMSTQSFTIRHPDTDIIGYCGYVLKDDGWAVPWMLTSERVYEIPRMVLRYSRYVFDRYYPKVPMHNFVGKDNNLSIQWLRWMGFEVMDQQDYFFSDPCYPFLFFRKELTQCVYQPPQSL